MKSNPANDLAEKCANAIAWIEEVTGEKVKGRLLETQKILRNLAEVNFRQQASGVASEAERKLVWQLVPASIDVEWLLEIYEGLRSNPLAKSLARQLKEIQGGPIFISDEKVGGNNSRPRDLQFELVLMAFFAKVGISPLFRCGESDGVYDLFGLPLFTECKRIHSRKGIRRAIKNAKDQILRARLANVHRSPVGLIAIESTKIFNDGTAQPKVGSEIEARRYMMVINEKILFELKKERLPDNILGIVVYHITAIVINGELRIGPHWKFLENPDFDRKLAPTMTRFKLAGNSLDPLRLRPGEGPFKIPNNNAPFTPFGRFVTAIGRGP